MLQFLKTKYFWISLSIMAGIVLSVIIIFMLMLGWFTIHGESVVVPSVKNLSFSAASKLIKEAGLNVEIADSVYDPEKKPMDVLRQVPAQGMRVKPHRTIYLTVNPSKPPKVRLPDIKDMSLRQAEVIINNLGLKLGKVTLKQDIAKNAVLDVIVNDKPIDPNMDLEKGTVINLVVGSGAQSEEIPVPDLLGITVTDARTILNNSSLTLGAIVADRTVRRDTEHAIIYKQTPENFTTDNNTINPSEAVDIFVTKDTVKFMKFQRLHIEKDNERTTKRTPGTGNDKSHTPND